jgi:hypothetical protein
LSTEVPSHVLVSANMSALFDSIRSQIDVDLFFTDLALSEMRDSINGLTDTYSRNLSKIWWNTDKCFLGVIFWSRLNNSLDRKCIDTINSNFGWTLWCYKYQIAMSTSPSRRLISTQCPVCCHNSANWSENISSGFCPSSRLSGRFHDGRTVLRNSFKPRMTDYFSRR